MEITRVTVTLNKNYGKVGAGNKNNRILGFAEVILDHCFAVTNIRIVKGDNRTFVAMPSIDCGTGEIKNGKAEVLWRDVVFPINSVTREYFEKIILNEYERVKNLSENEEDKN